MDLNTGISSEHREKLAAELSKLLADSYTLYLKTHNFHRALGLPAPGSYAAFGRLSTVPDTDGVPKALEMVKMLVEAHETVIRTARQVVHVAEAAGDQATADLGTQRLQLHEKTAWMLRSLLEN
ncbi:MAG: ferritin-like domain-containing protein [Polyangiales bacterium]